MNFQVQQIPMVRQLHKIGEVGKWNYISMTYSLSNNCTKKLLQSDAYCSSYRRRRSHMDFLRHSVEHTYGIVFR